MLQVAQVVLLAPRRVTPVVPVVQVVLLPQCLPTQES
eukprot:COSAG02_NODE_20476_length_830_cov_1.119015_1_plen_36_part_10